MRNLPDFSSTSVNIKPGTQTTNASASDSLQTSEFRLPDSGYIGTGIADDQQSTLSAEDDRGSEPSTMKHITGMAQAVLTQPLLQMVQTMQYPVTGEQDEDKR